jgi:hypothetical protein
LPVAGPLEGGRHEQNTPPGNAHRRHPGATAGPRRARHRRPQPRSQPPRGSAKCGPDGTFDFVVNQSNSESNPWNPAFITRSDGATGLLIPASLEFTLTTPEGTLSFTAQKGATSGPVSCDIFAEPAPGVVLVGTVTGTIILTG